MLLALADVAVAAAEKANDAASVVEVARVRALLVLELEAAAAAELPGGAGG